MNKIFPSDQGGSGQSNMGFYLSHPSGSVARGIEHISLYGHNCDNPIIKGCCSIAGRAVSLTVLPAFVDFGARIQKNP